MSEDNNTITKTLKVGHIDWSDPDTGMEHLFKWLMVEGTENLRKQQRDELGALRLSQSEIGFLNNLRSILMISANEDGTLVVSDELRDLLKKTFQPGNESLFNLLDELGLDIHFKYTPESYTRFFSGIKALPMEEQKSILEALSAMGIKENPPPSPTQLDQLVKFAMQPENTKLRKILTNNNLLAPKEKFSKAERENLIESIKVNVSQRQAIHEHKSQNVIHLQQMTHRMEEYIAQVAKDEKRTKDKILPNLK